MLLMRPAFYLGRMVRGKCHAFSRSSILYSQLAGHHEQTHFSGFETSESSSVRMSSRSALFSASTSNLMTEPLTFGKGFSVNLLALYNADAMCWRCCSQKLVASSRSTGNKMRNFYETSSHTLWIQIKKNTYRKIVSAEHANWNLRQETQQRHSGSSTSWSCPSFVWRAGRRIPSSTGNLRLWVP